MRADFRKRQDPDAAGRTAPDRLPVVSPDPVPRFTFRPEDFEGGGPVDLALGGLPTGGGPGDGAATEPPAPFALPRLPMPERPDNSDVERRGRVADLAALASVIPALAGAIVGPSSGAGMALMGIGTGAAAGASRAGTEADREAARRAQVFADQMREVRRTNLDLETREATQRHRDDRDARERAEARRDDLLDAQVTLATGAADSAAIVRAYTDRFPEIDQETAALFAARREVDAALEREGLEADVEAREALVEKRRQEILTEVARTEATEAQAFQRRASGEAALTRAGAAARRDDARAGLYDRTDPNRSRSSGSGSSAPPPPPAEPAGRVTETDTADALRFYRAGQLTAAEYEEITGRPPPR